MKNASKHADALKSRFRKLVKDVKDEPRQSMDPLRALLVGILSFDVADADAARRVETGTRLIANMTSLGGVSSRIEARSRWEGDRVPPGLLRLSVGLEDADALWDDLERALAAA